jgi:hypothetical protein
VSFLSSAYQATEGLFGVQADLLHYWEARQAAKAAGEELGSYADFPRDPDGQNSYVLMPSAGASDIVVWQHVWAAGVAAGTIHGSLAQCHCAFDCPRLHSACAY